MMKSEPSVAMQTLLDRTMYDEEEYRKCTAFCNTSEEVRMVKKVFVDQYPKVSVDDDDVMM